MINYIKRWYGYIGCIKPQMIPRIAWSFFRVVVLRQTVLKTVLLTLTPKCNIKCPYCYASKAYGRPMSKEQIQDISKQAMRLGCFNFQLSGGEPTLRRDIVDIVKILQPKKNIVSITTNSTMLPNDQILLLKDAGLAYLNLSLDSTIEDETDPNRGDEHYENVWRIINVCKVIDLRFDLCFIISHNTVKKLQEFCEYAFNIGAGYVAPIFYTPMGMGGDHKDEILTPDDWVELNRIFKEETILKPDHLQNMSLVDGCPGGREKLTVAANGDVIHCQASVVSMGNVWKEPLKVLWKRAGKYKHFAGFKGCTSAIDYEWHKILDKANKYDKHPIDYKEFE